MGQIDLTAYAGLSSVRVKFVLDDNRDTNGYYGEQNSQADGWYIDDVRIGEKNSTAPAAVTNLAVSSVTANSATMATPALPPSMT